MTPQNRQLYFKTETHTILNLHARVLTFFVIIPLYKIGKKNSSIAILDMSQNNERGVKSM
jgi:hypothetical protein